MTARNVPGASGSNLVGRTAGEVSTRVPGQIEYKTKTEKVGFEFVPVELADLLRSSGILVGTELIAGADAPVAKRRQDGTHYQYLSAWWTSGSRFVVFDARRDLATAGEGKLRPSGSWMASGTAHHFASPATLDRSEWRHKGADGTGAAIAGKRVVEDTLDALPPAVAGPVIGGTSHAWLRWRKGWASETIVASRVVGNEVHVLRAQREATSRDNLKSGTWVAEVMDATSQLRVPFTVAVPTGKLGGSSAPRTLNSKTWGKHLPPG
jgi:hypothetical protein